MRRLLICEAGDRLDAKSLIEAAERSSEKLRRHLARRIGEEGVRTLLSRSLNLAIAENPVMATIHISALGSLEGLHGTTSSDFQNTRDNILTDTVDGAVAFLTHFLTLLVTFIGKEITQRMVSTVWPEFAWDELAYLVEERP